MQVPVPITEIRGYDGSVTKIDCRYASHYRRGGMKDDYDLDIYKCADWLHRLITGQFLNEVEDESRSGEK